MTFHTLSSWYSILKLFFLNVMLWLHLVWLLLGKSRWVKRCEMGFLNVYILVYIFSLPENLVRLKEPESTDSHKSIVNKFLMLEHRLKLETGRLALVTYLVKYLNCSISKLSLWVLTFESTFFFLGYYNIINHSTISLLKQ